VLDLLVRVRTSKSWDFGSVAYVQDTFGANLEPIRRAIAARSQFSVKAVLAIDPPHVRERLADIMDWIDC